MHRAMKQGRKAIAGAERFRGDGSNSKLRNFAQSGMLSQADIVAQSMIAQRRQRADEIVGNEIKMSKVAKKMERLGGWRKRIFGIGKQQGGLSGSQLIHPYSPFSQLMTFMSGVLLMYSALVSTTMIGFLWNADPCQKMATLEFDMFVDVFFLVEICTNFFTGVISKGEYRDQLKFVAEEYLKGMFFFDIATSIPVSFIEYNALRQCEDGDGLSNQGLRVVRALKPLKIFRMLRSFKFIRVVQMFAHVGDYFRIPPFIGRILKMLVIVMLLCHACACLYWLVKELSNSAEDMNNWLISQNIYEGNQASLYEKYVISFYFINTVFCTVGFGDIAAENSEERLFNVAMFYMGALVFGTLLAEVQDALNKTRHKYRERQNTIQLMIDFLRSQDVPLHLEQRIVRWVDFSMSCLQNHEAQQEVLDIVPPNLHRELLGHLHGGSNGFLNFIPMFADLHHDQREQLVLDLWAMMEPVVCSSFVPLASGYKPADRMYVIVAGTVILQDDGVLHTTLHPGDAFGEYALLGDTDWGACRTLGEATFTAITNCMCLCLRKEAFEEVLASFDQSLTFEIFNSYKIKKEKHYQARRNSHASDAETGGLNPRIVLRWGEVCKQLVKNRRIKTAKKGFKTSADKFSHSTSLMIGRAAYKIAKKADDNINRRQASGGSKEQEDDYVSSKVAEDGPITPSHKKSLMRQPSVGGVIEPSKRGQIMHSGSIHHDGPARKASDSGVVEPQTNSPHSRSDAEMVEGYESMTPKLLTPKSIEGNGETSKHILSPPPGKMEESSGRPVNGPVDSHRTSGDIVEEIRTLSSKIDDMRQVTDKINQISFTVDYLSTKVEDVGSVSGKVDTLTRKMDALTRLLESLAREESVIGEDDIHVTEACA